MGSMDHFHYKLLMYAETLPDEKLTELCNDLACVFKDEELVADGKLTNEEYKKTIARFNEKWL